MTLRSKTLHPKTLPAKTIQAMMRDSLFSRRRFLSRSAGAAAVIAAGPLLIGREQSQAENPIQSAPAPPENNASVSGASIDRQNGQNGQKQQPVTRILADWVVASRPEQIPAAVQREAIRSVVNCVGATVGGSADETVTYALRAIGPYSGPPRASLFGRARQFDPPNAALINAISSHVLDYDDTELETIIHPAGVVASALFAISADHPLSGSDFLHSFVLGTEVECRIGKAIYPSHYQMGWHITATCGVFGAAAACGKVLGLNSQQMVWALGIAATQAAGLKVMFGSMCKSFQVGRASENGLMAALLAAQGFTSSDTPLEGTDGYFDAASRQHDDSRITLGLGEHYEISQNTYKPFPCGIVIHPAIDGILQLRQEDHLNADDIQSIVIRANPLVLQLTGKAHPQTGLEGKFSVYHSVAIGLVRGHVGLAEYSDEAVRDPQVVALRGLVQVTTDPAIRSDEAYLTVKTKDGHTYTKHVEHALGSLERPMTDADLEIKFRQLAAGVLPEEQANRLLAMCWTLPSLPDAAALTHAGALREPPIPA